MPASPFGLAYGLGAGIAGGQQQMQLRQQQATQLALQNAQLQQAQFQMAQQKAMNEALAAPVAPEMTPNTSLQGNLPSSPMAPDTQASASALGLPSASSVPNAPSASQMASVQGPQDTSLTKPVQYTTPYQKQAYELAQRAQMLQSKGFGLSALELQKQSMQYAQLHHDTALRMAGQAIGGGAPESAIPYLRSVGFDVNNISEDPNNPDNLMVTRDNGEVGSVPRTAAQLIGADPSKAAEVMSMIQWRKGTLGYKGQMVGVAQDRVAAQRERIDAMKQMWTDRNTTQKLVASIRASAPSQEAKTVAAEAQNMKAMNQDLSEPEAEALVWAQHRLKGGQSDPKLRAAINATTHISPYTQDPTEREALTNARNYVNSILQTQEPTKPTTTPKPETPAQGNPPTPDAVWSPIKKGWYKPDGKGKYVPVR